MKYEVVAGRGLDEKTRALILRYATKSELPYVARDRSCPGKMYNGYKLGMRI